MCGLRMGLCDGVKVRPRGTAFSEFPVEGTKPSPRCVGLRLELSGGDGDGSKHNGDNTTVKQLYPNKQKNIKESSHYMAVRLDHPREAEVSPQQGEQR